MARSGQSTASFIECEIQDTYLQYLILAKNTGIA